MCGLEFVTAYLLLPLRWFFKLHRTRLHYIAPFLSNPSLYTNPTGHLLPWTSGPKWLAFFLFFPLFHCRDKHFVIVAERFCICCRDRHFWFCCTKNFWLQGKELRWFWNLIFFWKWWGFSYSSGVGGSSFPEGDRSWMGFIFCFADLVFWGRNRCCCIRVAEEKVAVAKKIAVAEKNWEEEG